MDLTQDAQKFKKDTFLIIKKEEPEIEDDMQSVDLDNLSDDQK